MSFNHNLIYYDKTGKMHTFDDRNYFRVMFLQSELARILNENQAKLTKEEQHAYDAFENLLIGEQANQADPDIVTAPDFNIVKKDDVVRLKNMFDSFYTPSEKGVKHFIIYIVNSNVGMWRKEDKDKLSDMVTKGMHVFLTDFLPNAVKSESFIMYQ